MLAPNSKRKNWLATRLQNIGSAEEKTQLWLFFLLLLARVVDRSPKVSDSNANILGVWGWGFESLMPRILGPAAMREVHFLKHTGLSLTISVFPAKSPWNEGPLVAKNLQYFLLVEPNPENHRHFPALRKKFWELLTTFRFPCIEITHDFQNLCDPKRSDFSFLLRWNRILNFPGNWGQFLSQSQAILIVRGGGGVGAEM